MLKVDRAHYVVDKSAAYEDSPQSAAVRVWNDMTTGVLILG